MDMRTYREHWNTIKEAHEICLWNIHYPCDKCDKPFDQEKTCSIWPRRHFHSYTSPFWWWRKKIKPQLWIWAMGGCSSWPLYHNYLIWHIDCQPLKMYNQWVLIWLLRFTACEKYFEHSLQTNGFSRNEFSCESSDFQLFKKTLCILCRQMVSLQNEFWGGYSVTEYWMKEKRVEE